MHKLATDSETGIIGDERDLLRRSSFFGKNKKPLPQLPPVFESLKDAIDDKVLLALLAAAVFTMITGTVASDNPALGWVQGFSIILMVAVIVIITTVNDHMKDT
jgi:magnesium-transporting ATPase (P-type)